MKQSIMEANLSAADLEKYLPYMDGLDMTDEQKEQHLRALYTILDHFVAEAWGER